MHVLPLFVHGRSCPRCGARTSRVQTPTLLRPVRWMLPSATRRRCGMGGCGWRGFAFTEAARARTEAGPRLPGAADAR